MKIFIAGDFCPRGRVSSILETGDYSQVLGDVRKITSDVDYSVVNFECPVVVRENAKPIEKNGPNLKCSARCVEAIKWAGFDCATLGNNHILDYGDNGMYETIAALKKNGIDHVGGGMNIGEASAILYKKIGEQTIGIINCCEHEFSIATDTTAGANPINPVRQYNAIREAKKKANRVLVIVHGGHEHFQLPSPRMIETYRFIIDAGADAVVNHHQHCYSGYEIYEGKPIFYGLGNFCFDSFGVATKEWTEGYAVTIDFSDANPNFKIHPYRQCAEEPRVRILNPDAFDTKIKEINQIIADPRFLKDEIDKYYSRCIENYSNIFEPLYNRFYLGAKHRNLAPSLISRKRLLAAYNFIFCESHRDKLMWWLNRSK